MSWWGAGSDPRFDGGVASWQAAEWVPGPAARWWARWRARRVAGPGDLPGAVTASLRPGRRAGVMSIPIAGSTVGSMAGSIDDSGVTVGTKSGASMSLRCGVRRLGPTDAATEAVSVVGSVAGRFDGMARRVCAVMESEAGLCDDPSVDPIIGLPVRRSAGGTHRSSRWSGRSPSRGALVGATVGLVFALAACAGADDGAGTVAGPMSGPVSGSVESGVSIITTVPGVSAADGAAADVSAGLAGADQSLPVPPSAATETTGPLVVATTAATIPTSTITSTTMISTGEATPAPVDPRSPRRVEFPDDPDRQAVVDAAYAFFDTARAAQADPGNESLRALLATTMTEPIASRLTKFLDQLVLDGIHIIANPDSPTYLEIFEPSVTQVDGSGLIDVCAVDSDIRVVVATGEIVNDNITSSLQTYLFESVGGVWRVREFQISDIQREKIGCD